MPAHFKAALLEGIAAALEGTDHNYVVVHGNGQTHAGEKTRRHLVMLDIETSRELI